MKPWQTAQVLGVVRFRDRVFNLVTGKPLIDNMDDETLRAMHKTIKKVLCITSRIDTSTIRPASHTSCFKRRSRTTSSR